MVRQEDTILVLFRMREVVLRSSLSGDRAFDKDAPPYGILEGCTQQPMNLVDGGAGKEPLLLLFGQFLLLALDIQTAGCFAQGRVEVLHVVGLELLHLHAADIGDNEVLDGGKVRFVGFGCPLVLAALLGQPIHEELCRRHRGRDQKSARRQFVLNLLLSVRCLLFGGKALPFVAALAVFIFVGVSDAVRIAALRYRHPPLVLWVYGGYQNDNSHFRTIKRCDCLVDGQNDHQPESVRYS